MKTTQLIPELLHLAPLRLFLPAACMSLLSSLSAIVLMGAAAWIITSAALHPPLFTLAVAITLVRTAGISRAVFRYLDRWLSHRATFQLLTRLRTCLYETAASLLPLKAPGTSQGALLHELTAGMDCLRDFYLRVLAPPLLTLLLMLVASACLLPLSETAALLPPAAWLLSLLSPLLLGEKPAAALGADYRSCLLDALGGRIDLQAANQAEPMRQQLDAAARELTDALQKKSRRKNLADTLTDLVCNLALAGTFACLLPIAGSGTISGIELAVYLLSIQTLLAEFQALPEATRVFLCTGEALAALLPALHAARSIPKTSLATNLPAAKSPEDAIPPLLSAQDIHFAYTGQQPLLHGLSFTISQGSKTAIIGESGAGKTTLFHLLLGIWTPDKGTLLLQGRPYSSYTNQELHQFFAAATQSCYIFSDSIRENFSRLYQDISEDAVWQALETAQLADIVRALPDGLDTPLGEDGCRLSGGQRQRLLIALAMASAAPILLLDEPTAGLDRKTAQELLAAVLEKLGSRTLLLITHDLPLLSRMDQIIEFGEEKTEK